MIFSKQHRDRLRQLENDVARLTRHVAVLNCEAGRHEWALVNADEPNPHKPPYLRCPHCYATMEKTA